MVNENTETSSSNNCFNFQFSSSNQNFRSLSNSLNNPDAVNSVNATEQLDLLVATNQTLNKKKCDLLSVSADNLSWKFFEQIDSLDTRLRKEEVSNS